ncbi:MAG: nucleotidyltransferase family protein [Chromatiales bacterium]|nr:nucleotidyltransferase family protein [Chromatiales bacterium]
MRAMILAAGRGERMRPLTNHTPKPLLEVGGHALIEYHLQALKKAGVSDVVINVSHLGAKIEERLGSGSHYGVSIEYSREPMPLETAGGIVNALDLLGPEPFLVINGDIWCDYPLSAIPRQMRGLAHLVLVDNPEHHPLGDFYLRDGRVASDDHDGQQRLTFAGVGLYHPHLFESIVEHPATPAPLAPLLIEAMQGGLISGEYYRGEWYDIGTPERLRALDYRIKQSLKIS